MKIADSVATFIAKTLDANDKLVADKNVVQIFRMNYYPQCSSAPDKVLGFSPHSDGSFLTILLEVNSVQGLQIRRHGEWIPVRPRTDAYIIG
jgi:isopenicillin N synthase-like dioxygenase